MIRVIKHMSIVKQKQQQKRKELALTFISLIDKKGFNHITVQELCQEANISIGSFYHYFKDKNDVIREFFFLIDEYFKQVVEPDVTTFPNALLNIRYFCAYYAYYTNGCGFEVCRQISIVPLLNCHENFTTEDRYLFRLLLSFIEEGQRKHQVSCVYTAQQLTSMIMNMLRGYCADWCKNNGSYDILTAIDTNCLLYLSAIQTDQAALEECVKHILTFKSFDWLSHSADKNEAPLKP